MSNEIEFEDDDVEFEEGKRIRYRIVAEIDLPENLIYDLVEVEAAIKGEFVKVKSGLYENIASGFVTEIERISDNTEETE